MNSPFIEIATEIGALVEEKSAAYGSSFAKAGEFLQLLFPAGIPLDRYRDALLLVRIFDKQMRIATDKDALGESPYQNIAGYGILGVSLHHERNECASQPSTPADSAPAPGANGILAGTPSFVLQSVARQTTPSASAPNAPSSSSSSSQPPASSSPSEVTPDATARTATENVLSDEAALQALSFNNKDLCAYCLSSLPSYGAHVRKFLTRDDHFHIRFCSRECSNKFWRDRMVKQA